MTQPCLCIDKQLKYERSVNLKILLNLILLGLCLIEEKIFMLDLLK